MKSSKHKLPWFVVAAIAALFFVFLVNNTLAGDPVPGIDISLDEIPGGKIRTIKTDANGNYVFDRLTPGVYVLRLGPLNPAKVENHNSSRSNKTYPLKRPDGTEDHTVNITVGKKILPGKDPGTRITISNRGGRIFGRVAMDVGIKEEGVK